jgi:hypothetical protein
LVNEVVDLFVGGVGLALDSVFVVRDICGMYQPLCSFQANLERKIFNYDPQYFLYYAIF